MRNLFILLDDNLSNWKRYDALHYTVLTSNPLELRDNIHLYFEVTIYNDSKTNKVRAYDLKLYNGLEYGVSYGGEIRFDYNTLFRYFTWHSKFVRNKAVPFLNKNGRTTTAFVDSTLEKLVTYKENNRN